jgi:HSP20 family molecular chaperone IbpA
LRETDDAYVVEFSLPGARKRDINVSVAGRRQDGVRANLDDGVLTVTVPKAASQRRRRIQVR